MQENIFIKNDKKMQIIFLKFYWWVSAYVQETAVI